MSRTRRCVKPEVAKIKSTICSLKKIKEVFEKTKDESVFFSNYLTHSLTRMNSYSSSEKISAIDCQIEFLKGRLKRLNLDRAFTHQEFVKYASNIARKSSEKNIINQIWKTRLEDIEDTDFNSIKEKKKCKKIKWIFSD